MGNYWLNKVVNLLYGTRYTDLCYGYNAFRRECLSVIALDAGSHAGEESTEMRWGDGFEVETLINIRIVHAGAPHSRSSQFRAEPYPWSKQSQCGVGRNPGPSYYSSRATPWVWKGRDHRDDKGPPAKSVLVGFVRAG